ncbi:MAG: SLC13 family permease [Planctomycetota bacterium]
MNLMQFLSDHTFATTLVVLAVTLWALIREWGPPDLIFVGSLVALVLGRVLKPGEAFAGFSSPSVLMGGALFMVAAAMRETGAMDAIGQRLLGNVHTENAALLLVGIVSLIASAFLNNTTIVAMFLPLLLDWSRKRSISPSRLLIPLSFFTIMGGTCTLIGPSTNLVVQSQLEKRDLPLMSFFELGWVGIPCAIIGTVYMFSLGRWFLPNRKELLEQLADSRREYLVEMIVQPDCRLIGQTIEAAGLRNLPGLFLIEIDREGNVIGPVAPGERIQSQDRLIFTGVVDTIVDLKRIPGLVAAGESKYEVSSQAQRGRVLCEAVVSATSPLIGSTIRHAELRARSNAAVVAVHRNGERMTNKIGDIELQQGDTLLLQTGVHFLRAHRNNPDFYLVADVADSRPLRHDRATICVVLFLGLVAALATESFTKLDPMIVSFAVAGLMIATRCISTADARQAVEWPVLVSIAASFGLGTALEKSGVAKEFADSLVHYTSGYGPIAALAAIYFGTMVLNELITNNGAANLAFPFCLAVAASLQVDARPFIIAVTLAASYAFASPIGYQTHMMVFGPGGYRFSDFVKVGLPLNLLLWITATLLIPLFWPFHP